MSGHQFIVTDIDFQQLQQSNEEKTIISAPVKEEDIFYLSSDQFAHGISNFEVVETMDNTMSIPEGSNYTIPFSDEQIQLLMQTVSDNEASSAKMGLDLSGLLGNVVPKSEPMMNSHLVKYKSDENGKNVKVWECGICHKEFGHQYILMRHLPTHTDERKFQCKQCGKAFRQMSTLSQHRAIHSKLRPYICEVCQKTFNRVSTLISHRKTHTGLKPHCCHLCNKAFHQKGNLRNHIFTHTNERPYKCDVCQKGFNQMSNLMCHKFKAHQRADKPKYSCQSCGKEFDKRISLRNHEQYEHGDPVVSSTSNNIPSVKYSNGVLVSPINTAAMKHAVATNQVPFALLRPLNGIPVLVRILPAGVNQMLVPATAEDLKKFGEITIKRNEDQNNTADNDDMFQEALPTLSPDISNNTAVFKTGDDKRGSTVQIRIPVVASVVQRCRDGTVHMDIESPGPRRESDCLSTCISTSNIDEIAQDLKHGVIMDINGSGELEGLFELQTQNNITAIGNAMNRTAEKVIQSIDEVQVVEVLSSGQTVEFDEIPIGVKKEYEVGQDGYLYAVCDSCEICFYNL
ncbi:PREDICTED: zinc finger protein 300-like [Nicrophorus vespilloides]|uniref:Zinc finger protein 300-like n=1 Tax=Nicrophorus vespilloides TaxID=110193 RepID=A0ABM1MXN9_NICVS|nr:PREDICTED: zinc finger protein 300-like [Nicrophorus vespilloides]